jgi:hypothetical protein
MDKSFAIECPPFEVTLSHWDRILPPIHTKRILCFSLPTGSQKQQLVEYLHIAFHNTIQRVPFLAGSVIPFPEDQGGRPWIKNIIPKGTAQLIIKDLSDKMSFSELAKANFSQHLLHTELLCPLPEIGYFTDEPIDICHFQANFVKGGLLLVESIIHNISDGRGNTEVLEVFANELCKAQAGQTGYPLEMRTSLYRSDRTAVLSGHGVPGDIDMHDAWTSTPFSTHSQLQNVKNSCRTFHISTEALSSLKKILTTASRGPDDWFSTNDAISGFIWRSIMVARHRAGLIGADVPTYVAQPIDCRPHLKIPKPYFGNAIYMTQSSLPLSILQQPESGVAAGARALRADIKTMTAERMRDLVGYVERTSLEAHTRMAILEYMATSGIILSSLFKMGLHSIDFGPALGDHIKALRLPATGTPAGAIIVLPMLPDGSCQFMITEQESTIRCLLDDEFFSRHTNDESAYAGYLEQPDTASSPKSSPTEDRRSML